MIKKIIRCTLILLLLPLAACVPEEPKITDYEANFNALWNIINERYCFLEDKGIDWDKVYRDYSERLKKEQLNDIVFFNLMADMLGELKDGHVNLISNFNVSRYHGFNPEPTRGLNIYARNRALKLDKNFISGGMQYGLYYSDKDPSSLVGYIAYGSFEKSLGDLVFMTQLFEKCKAVILDVRGNGGGYVNNSDKLASIFFTEKTLVGYSSYKLSPRRGDFSELKPLYIEPHPKVSWTNKPVIILQDNGCYSATNDFLYKVARAKNVTRIGQRSGGGAGLPATSELPNGWRVRYSAVKNFDWQKRYVEGGIEPDIKVENQTYTENPAASDAILHTAFEYTLKRNYTPNDQQ